MKHILDTYTLDQLSSFHSNMCKIGDDFELTCHSNGVWLLIMKIGGYKAFVTASQPEVALWKSREAMYKLFSKIDSAGSLEEVKAILKEAPLDHSKIEQLKVPRQKSGEAQEAPRA